MYNIYIIWVRTSSEKKKLHMRVSISIFCVVVIKEQVEPIKFCLNVLNTYLYAYILFGKKNWVERIKS